MLKGPSPHKARSAGVLGWTRGEAEWRRGWRHGVTVLARSSSARGRAGQQEKRKRPTARWPYASHTSGQDVRPCLRLLAAFGCCRNELRCRGGSQGGSGSGRARRVAGAPQQCQDDGAPPRDHRMRLARLINAEQYGWQWLTPQKRPTHTTCGGQGEHGSRSK